MKQNGDINIRLATADDLTQIVSYTHAIHQQEDDQSIPTHTNFLSNLEKWIKEELKNPLSLILIAEIVNKQGNKAIGFIGSTTLINDNGFLDNPTKGVINFLWVEKEHRRKNIATQLVSMIEDCFKKNAINVIECSFTKKNQLAETFWASEGYQIQSVIARKILPHD
ncbi:MAG: hypothetical protein COB38_01145 [Gammaproteobacteria bacterium]|nr:MAG: hypothetical protein COB38_01145 [Gammaproteobacteria bacterium]